MKLKNEAINAFKAKLDNAVKKHKTKIESLTKKSKFTISETDIKDGYIYVTVMKRLKIK